MDLITVLALLFGCLLAQLNMAKTSAPEEALQPTEPANVKLLKALLSVCLAPREAPPS